MVYFVVKESQCFFYLNRTCRCQGLDVKFVNNDCMSHFTILYLNGATQYCF